MKNISKSSFNFFEPQELATIPAIVLLKLLAYSDRPEHRLKDLYDIRDILTDYFDRFSEDIYEKHADLFDE